MKLPLKRIYNKALIGYAYSACTPRCFLSHLDAQEPIPVYDLEMIEEIHFRELKKRMPKQDPDDLWTSLLEEEDRELSQLRAIYVQETQKKAMKISRKKRAAQN
jgi:hypothetical protein